MHLFRRFLSSFMEQEVSEYMVFEEPMWKLHHNTHTEMLK